MRRTTIIVTSLVLSLWLLAPVLTAQEWGVVTDAEWQLQPPEDYPDAEAVVIFDNGIATAELKGLQFKRHMRIKVFDAENIAEIKDISIEYYDYDKLDDLNAQILRADGTIIEFDKKDFETIEKGSLRETRFSFPNVQDGDILEYRYGIDYYGGLEKLGPEKYFLFSQEKHYEFYKAKQEGYSVSDANLEKNVSNIPTWFFDHPVYCLSSTFGAKLGSALDYVYFPANLPDDKVEPVTERIKFMTATAYKLHTWTLENIPPYMKDTSPLFDQETYRKGLHFQLFSTVGQNRVIRGAYTNEHWQHVGESFQGYVLEYVKTTKKMRNHARKLVKGAPDARSKVEAVYQYVTENYTADSTGYALRPSHSNLKGMYSDKKGMPFEINLLFIEMLKIGGVEAWPVLISTRNKLSFRHTARFNHMLAIVDIDGEKVLMDASVKGCPMGALTPLCTVDEGLFVNYDLSQPIPIAADRCEGTAPGE